MTDRRLRVLAGLMLVGAVTVVGTVWFALVEGFSWIDAGYQSVITVSTVGFEEVETLDRSGRLFTIALIIVGVGAIVFALGSAVEAAIESSLSPTLIVNFRPLADSMTERIGSENRQRR